MCDTHLQMYKAPIAGISRPAHADEEWRPSIMDCIRQAQIAMIFEDRNKRPELPSSLGRPDDAKRYTPAQLAQVMILRKHISSTDDCHK
jgi:hypothetical protein